MTTPDDPRIALAEAAGAIYPDLLLYHLDPNADAKATSEKLQELRQRFPSAFEQRPAQRGVDGGTGRNAPTYRGRIDINAFIRGR